MTLSRLAVLALLGAAMWVGLVYLFVAVASAVSL